MSWAWAADGRGQRALGIAGLAAEEGGGLRMVLREQVTEAGCQGAGAQGTQTAVTKNTGTQGLYSSSSSRSGSRCGHKQAAQGPVSLNGREQKQEASSLRRVRAGKCKAWQQLSAERGSVSMDGERASGKHGMEAGRPGRSVLGRAGGGENEWARPGSTGSAGQGSGELGRGLAWQTGHKARPRDQP